MNDFPPDRHLALLHDFEEGALNLGGGAVDLVGKQKIGKNRTQGRPEVPCLLVVDARPDQVGRNEVGRELDALELAPDGLRKRSDRHRLRKAGDAFDQDVAASEQRHDQALQEVILADDDLLHLVEEALHWRGAVLTDLLVHAHRSLRFD